MQTLERIIAQITLRLSQVAQAALVLVMLIIVANILMRTLWKPLPGSYELVQMLGAVLLSLGIAYCAVHRGHVAVSFLVDKMPLRVRALVDLLTNALFLAVISYVSWGMIIYAGRMYGRGLATQTLYIPLYPIYYLVGFGLITLAIVSLLQLANSALIVIRGGKDK